MVMVTCGQCGKSFSVWPHKVRDSNFCSRDCYFEHKRAGQVVVHCERCGKEMRRPRSWVARGKRVFCSMSCRSQTVNPTRNKTLMTPEVREKLRKARLGRGAGVSYTKTYGRHTHRVVAEEKLGRPLFPGEIVHHIDGNKRNNDPENLAVLSSQSVHAQIHSRFGVGRSAK